MKGAGALSAPGNLEPAVENSMCCGAHQMDCVEGRLAKDASSCCPVDVNMSTIFGLRESYFVPSPTPTAAYTPVGSMAHRPTGPLSAS